MKYFFLLLIALSSCDQGDACPAVGAPVSLRLPSLPRQADRLTAVVVFPTPPFWLAMAMTLGTARFKGMTLVISRHSTRMILSKPVVNPLRIAVLAHGQVADGGSVRTLRLAKRPD